MFLEPPETPPPSHEMVTKTNRNTGLLDCGP